MILIPNPLSLMFLKKHELKLANLLCKQILKSLPLYITYTVTEIYISHKLTLILINELDLNETHTSVICLRLGDGGLW